VLELRQGQRAACGGIFKIVEHRRHIRSDALSAGEKHAVHIEPCRRFVEVSRGQGGEPFTGPVDQYQFCVHLHGRHTVQHRSAHFLQTRAVADVALFIEPGLQFNNSGHLLAVTRRVQQGIDNLGMVRQAVYGCLDFLHFGINGGLAQQADDMVKRLVGIGKQHILIRHNVQHGLPFAVQHGMVMGRHGFKYQVLALSRKAHQVAHVVIASAADGRIRKAQAQRLLEQIQQFRGHLVVIDEPGRPAAFALQQHLLHLADIPFGEVVVHVELGIAGNLEFIGADGLIVEDVEDFVQGEADDVVHIHDASVGQFHKTGERRRQFEQGV